MVVALAAMAAIAQAAKAHETPLEEFEIKALDILDEGIKEAARVVGPHAVSVCKMATHIEMDPVIINPKSELMDEVARIANKALRGAREIAESAPKIEKIAKDTKKEFEASMNKSAKDLKRAFNNVAKGFQHSHSKGGKRGR